MRRHHRGQFANDKTPACLERPRCDPRPYRDIACIGLDLVRRRNGARGADLYRAQAIVTGQGEANRIIGYASCLEDVLIKVSGAQKLAGDRRLASYKSNAKSFVRAFSYHDQMSGKPHRDEQGTRDRPYDLIVDFDEGKIGNILKALAIKPWLSHRPRLAVFVEMKLGAKNYIVTSDGVQSDLQRDALLAAADKRGMDIVLPSAAALTKSNLDSVELKTAPSSILAPVVAEQGGEVALVGQLVWDDRELGWARSGRWTGVAGRTVGKFVASHLTKPSGAVSAAPLRFYLAVEVSGYAWRRETASGGPSRRCAHLKQRIDGATLSFAVAVHVILMQSNIAIISSLHL